MERETLTFQVIVDGEEFSPGTRYRLSGRYVIGIVPSVFHLKAWDLLETDVYRLMNSKKMMIVRENSCLARGDIKDVYQETVPEGTITHVMFSLGLDLWNSFVSVFVDQGISVSEEIGMILGDSGTDYQLLTFDDGGLNSSRGRAYLGRAAESVAEALSAASVRGYLIEGGIGVIPYFNQPAVLHLKENDVLDVPSYADGRKKVVLSTRVIGYQPGDEMDLEYKGKYLKGLIIERMIFADTKAGPWNTQLLIELDDPGRDIQR